MSLSGRKGLIMRLLRCILTRLILLKFSVIIFFILFIIYHVSITSLPCSNTSYSEITAKTQYADILVCMTANTSMMFYTNFERELVYLIIYFPSRNVSYKMSCLYEIRCTCHEGIYIYIYIHTYTYIYTYIYII